MRSGWQGPLGKGAGHKDRGGGGKASAAAEQKGGSAATYIFTVNLADSPLDSSRSLSWWNATLASWEMGAPRLGSARALAKAGGNEAIAGGTRVGTWKGQNQAKLWQMVGGGIRVGGTFSNDKMGVSGAQRWRAPASRWERDMGVRVLSQPSCVPDS